MDVPKIKKEVNKDGKIKCNRIYEISKSYSW